jgi:SseB protein N-terminal domain/SseB protein C-terminal domain
VEADVSEPLPLIRPENALEDALLAARENDDLEHLLVTLALADVYIPAEEPGPDEETRVTAKAGEQLPLPVIELDGQSFVPVFTSLTQLARFRPEGGGYVRLLGRALSAITPSDVGVAINPGGDLGLPLTPDQVASLATAEPGDSEAEFLIGEPREEPRALLETIGRFAEERPEIRAAYRALLVRRPGAKPEHVIGLELRPGADAEAAIEAAAEAAREAGVERLALLPLEPGVDAGQIGRFLLGQTQPFWSRGDGG